MRRAILSLLLVTLGVGRLDAQTIFEQFNFEFSFSAPGARANGMGRAATALPDDATAAETNPAGLTLWDKTLLAAEVKSTSFSTLRFAKADAFATFQTQAFGERVTGPSFFSLVRHSKSHGFSFALFGQEYLRYEENFSLELRRIPGTTHYFFPVEGSLKLTGSNWGMAVARKLGFRLALGVSLKLSVLSMRGRTERGHIFDTRLDPARLTNIQQVDDRDYAFGMGAGILWQAFQGDPSGTLASLNLGASYSWNPRFSVEEQYSSVTDSGALEPVPGYPRRLEISVPDRLALGLAARFFGSRLTLATDVVWMRYSELGGSHSSIIPDIGEYRREEFQAEDQIEVQMGAEMALGRHLRLRAGAYSVPSHRLRYEGETETITGRGLELTFNLGRNTTQWAGTAGVGFLVSQHLDVNAAYVFAPSADDFVLSAAYSF